MPEERRNIPVHINPRDAARAAPPLTPRPTPVLRPIPLWAPQDPSLAAYSQGQIGAREIERFTPGARARMIHVPATGSSSPTTPQTFRTTEQNAAGGNRERRAQTRAHFEEAGRAMYGPGWRNVQQFHLDPAGRRAVEERAQVPAGSSIPLPREAMALLNTIAATESRAAPGEGYNMIYGGQTFSDFSDHPRVAVPISRGTNVGRSSSAAGRYQFLGSTWDAARRALGLTDFSPESQDRAAWWLAEQSYGPELSRDLQIPSRWEAIARSLSPVWTSLPYSPTGERGQTMAEFTSRLGSALDVEQAANPRTPQEFIGRPPSPRPAPRIPQAFTGRRDIPISRTRY